MLRDLTHGGANLSRENSRESSTSLQDNPFGTREALALEDTNVEDQSGFSSPSDPFDSNNSSTAFLNSNGTSLAAPPAYDRYPTLVQRDSNNVEGNRDSIPSTRDSVSSLLPSVDANTGGGSTATTAPALVNPFLTDADFSPFGGYPASSFPLSVDEKEPDDYLHNPDPIADAKYDKNRFVYDLKHMDKRSAGGLFGLVMMLIGGLAVFIVLPVLTYSGVTVHSEPETYQVLTDYTYPTLSALRSDLVDPDTPDDALSRQAKDGSYWNLVFSDEFNAEGRTFYDGDDQFWYAPDLNYAATEDLEWYDPDAVTTANGTLNLRLDAIKQHNLFYRSGMLHSWNRMCYTQGILEFSARLPNYAKLLGLWPGMWSMGNLGRPGYMATTDGTWPYSYEACDAGITANQSSPDGISYLKGQRLNSCTCSGEDHPNSGTGRGAPEIDVIEGENDATKDQGIASQSLQIAPMDIWYYPDYEFCEIHNSSITSMNPYTGGPYQQAVSATTTLNATWYEKGTGLEHRFQKYSYEYLNDNDDGYIRWFVGDDPTLTMHAYALAPNGNVDWRRISKEPMSIIANLGLSNSWTYIDWPTLSFPMTLEIDYVRLYQPNDSVSVTCDPDDYPTYDYINDHENAYENYNLTSWEDAGYSYPKNKLTGC